MLTFYLPIQSWLLRLFLPVVPIHLSSIWLLSFILSHHQSVTIEPRRGPGLPDAAVSTSWPPPAQLATVPWLSYMLWTNIICFCNSRLPQTGPQFLSHDFCRSLSFNFIVWSLIVNVLICRFLSSGHLSYSWRSAAAGISSPQALIKTLQAPLLDTSRPPQGDHPTLQIVLSIFTLLAYVSASPPLSCYSFLPSSLSSSLADKYFIIMYIVFTSGFISYFL